MSRLVTLPKGRPREMTSASLMSLGSLRTWMTRDGTPGLRMSPLNFLLSLPFAERGQRGRHGQGDVIKGGGKKLRTKLMKLLFF